MSKLARPQLREEQCVALAGAYLKTDDGRRFHETFRAVAATSPVLEAFVADMSWRLQEVDGEAAGFWRDLCRAAAGDDNAVRLALDEPLAQAGKSVRDLLNELPAGVDSELALVQAYSRIGSAQQLPRGISDTRGWSEGQLLEKLDEVRAKLDWENTTGSAHNWWEAFEKENKHRLPLVLRLAEELAVRRATITEFFLAYVYSSTDNIQANLCYLDYTRLKKEEERKKRAAKAVPAGAPADAAAPPTSSPVPASESLPPGITDTRGWAEERVLEKLGEVRAKLDWENTTGGARKWWEAFEIENKHRSALVLRLAEELAVRKATVAEFFVSYVYSNTDNIQANLCYLDYVRLKKEEERKARAQKVDSLLSELRAGRPPSELGREDLVMLKDAALDRVDPQLRDNLKQALASAEARAENIERQRVRRRGPRFGK